MGTETERKMEESSTRNKGRNMQIHSDENRQVCYRSEM